MQPEQIYQPKTFELTEYFTGNTHTCIHQVIYLPSTREINISKALLQICSQGFNLNNCNLFYSDFDKKQHVYIGVFPFQQQLFLKYESFLDRPITIRYRSLTDDVKNTKKITVVSHLRQVKERTICQVQEYVNSWRSIYSETNQHGRIHTLQSAANAVGVSKKTLDDYYYHMRRGQYYGFNFEAHKIGKIGVLRRFIKNAIKEQRQRQSVQSQKPVHTKDEDSINGYLFSDIYSNHRRYSE